MGSVITINQSIVKEFKFNLHACPVNKNRIIQLLGYDPNIIPEPVLECLDFIFKALPDKIRLRSGYKIFNQRKVAINGEKFVIDNRTFNCGKIILSHLKNSETIAFIVSSVGEEIENWSKHFMENNELLKGYLIDVVASELVEQLSDKTELLLKNEIEQFELKATNRYSPGYCGWNVADQQNLFSLLPQKFCGVSLNDNSIMTPIKSVSAVVGIGKSVENKNYECSICEIDFCYKRDRNA